MSNRAWVTLATNDSYGLGALVLAHSLRRAGSSYPAVVLITPSVTDAMRDRLRAVFAEVVTVDVLDSRDAAHLALLQRPELGITFTKIHCWNLTQYEKCVFLDADALVVQNCDELFEREELSASPDVGWPDCFNSGVFVYTPSADTFNRLVQFAQDRGSFDGGDQGLLNSFFSDWAHGDINKHLPFLYNVTSAAFYSYMPALKHYGQDLKIIHFIGAAKPWLQHFNWESRAVDAPEHLRQFLQIWWDLFVADVHAQLDVSMVEVEAPHHEHTNEQPPVLPPQDISQHFHYQPVLDPNSEFPWHRTDAQIEKDTQEQHIDMSEIFDPWDIYRGHIPPSHENLSSHYSEGKTEEQRDLRKYVWENYNQYHTLDKEPHENNERLDHIQQWSHRHIDSYQYTPEPPYIHVYNQTTYSQHNTQPEVQYEHQKHFLNYEQETSKRSYNRHENLSEQNHCHQEYSYNTELRQDYSQQQCAHENTIYTEHCENLDHFPNNNHNNFQHINRYEHEQNNDFHNQSHIHIENSHHDHCNHSQTYEPNYSKTGETQNNTERIHEITENQPNNLELNTSATPKQQNVEVQHVIVEHERKNNCRHRKDKTRTIVSMANKKANGDVSNSEDELEDVIPRHPYDGFYLRHMVTIDSRGRKICTHEIPTIPSSFSSSECSEAPEYFSAEETMSDFEHQSGVAGNFARVTLGSTQREAIDELTRRQGWEAGNIDYMGADSFDNIWAKISQTLSQARPSPPKQSPPREAAPSQSTPEQVNIQTGEIAQEPITDPVEVAKEVVPSEEPILVQEPEVKTTVASTNTVTIPTQTVQIESIVQSETVTPTETESLTKTSTTEADVTAEVSAPTQTSEVPAETLPLTSTELVTATEPSTKPEEPIVAEVLVPVEKVVEQSPISKAPASDESSVIVADAVTEVTPQATEVITPPTVIDAPASEIPISVEAVISGKIPSVEVAPEVEPVILECKDKTEATPKEPVTDSVKVPSAVTKLQSEPVQEVVEEKIEAPITVTTPVEPVAVPVKVPSADTALPAEPTLTKVAEKTETPITETNSVKPVTETPNVEKPVQTAQALPAESSVCPVKSTQEKTAPCDSASDSPPLANTPSIEEIPDVSAAKSAERRKPAGKLQLSPPVAPDPLPTPDSELEDAAALAQSIIASELRTPTVTSPGLASSPVSPPAPLQHSRLSVDEPEVPTPPVGAVSLAQIGVKTKGKTTIAAQIESSVSDKPESATPTPTEPTTKKIETAPAEVPKKKVVKKVVKKVSATGGDTPVPPPRKKEKKPKE